MKLKKLYLQALLIWIIFSILTVGFGAFRELVFIPLSNLSGNLARALLLPVAFFYIIGITYLFLKRTKAPYKKRDMINIGLLWFLMTILFEFSFGHLVMGHPIKVLLTDYDIFSGRTWVIFLL